MNKKGFTLVEILGVIIILATILAIAMPKITDTIYEAQYKAFTNDVNELHGITKLEYNNKNEYRTYYFEDGKQVNIEEVGKLDFKGDNPGRGYIEIYQNGDIEFYLVSKNEKFCASKSVNEETATIQNCGVVDSTKKENFNLETSYISTTNSILVTLIPKNGEKDVVITDYYYRLDNGKIINSSKANHLFKKLKNTDENGNAKKYNITVKACSKSGTCKEEKKKITMQLIDDIEYTLSTTDWSKEKTITFKYPDLKDTEGNSIGINEISTDLGKTFTKYTGEITVKEDTTFVARVSDGTNSITSASIKVIKFDYEAPTITNVSGNPSNWTNKNVTIVVNGASDNGKSGLAEQAYSFDGGVTWQKENSKTYTSNTSNIVIKVRDKLDNIYTHTSEINISKIDKTGPSKPTITLFKGVNYTVNSSYSSGSWTNQDILTSAKSSDSESGIAYYEYTNDKVHWSGDITKLGWKTTYYSGKNELQYWIAWQIGKINFYVRAVDNVGNKGEISNIFTLGIDKESPSTPTTMNFVFSNWSGYSNNSWTNQDVYAGRTSSNPGPTGSTDNLSGICKYQISSDGSNYRDYAYNSSDSMYYMHTTGTHTRYFRAVDCAGNVGNAISRVARIDKGIPTAPSILGQLSGWVNYYQIVWVTNTSSSYSGIKKYQFCDISVNDVSKCTWKDLYNNTTGVVSGLDVAYYHASNGDLINKFLGNVNSLNSHYNSYGKNEGRNPSNSSWVRTAQNISSEGVHYVFFRAINNAGTNGYSSGSQNINIDVTAPTFSWSHSWGQGVAFNEHITFYCSDSLSGQNKATLCDAYGCGTSTQTYAYVFGSDVNPSWILEGTCVDNAGNSVSAQSAFSIYNPNSGGSTCNKGTCTGYKYSGGGTGASCSAQGGTSVATSKCGGSYSFCCRIPYSYTCCK